MTHRSEPELSGSMTAISGIGKMNLPPHVPAWAICSTISCWRFHGWIRM